MRLVASARWVAFSVVATVVLLACGSPNAPDRSPGYGTGGSGSGTGGAGPSGGTGAVTAMVPSCGAVPDCGGDPEGDWDITSGCLHVLANPYTREGCEDALAGAAVDVGGNYTFLADTLTFDLDVVVHHTISISDFCASATFGTSVRAADRCPSFEQDYGSDPDVTEAVCTVTEGRCVCEVTFVPQHALGSSPIELRGNQIVDGNGLATDYCVDGDRLTLYFADASDPPAPGDTGVELELQRQ